VFRLVPDRAVINRYGFNSEGLEVAKERLQKYRKLRDNPEATPLWRKILTTLDLVPEIRRSGIVGVNVGCNKENAGDPRNDYAEGIRNLGPEADYLVVNISSPNTPGLRAMQKKENLENLIMAAVDARAQMMQTTKLDRFVPLLVKIAPDLSAEEMTDIADIALRLKIDGLVVSNTTISRPLGLQSDPDLVKETGGLSGAPLKTLAQKTLSEMYRLTKGQIPLIGVGGISNGKDAYERIKAGASLVQLYSGITYEGIGVATRIHSELIEFMQQDGFTKISQATGFYHRRRDAAASVADSAKQKQK
jgi:dihydroorotate dehydrogenase